jgi:hypothetical protein
MHVDNMSVKQRLTHFHKQNGADCIKIGNWLVYSNGARRDVDPYGLLIAPPHDAYESSQIQLQYREELLQQSVEAFAEKKQQLTWLAENNHRSGYGPPSESEMDELKRLQNVVRSRQRKVKAARDRVTASKPERLRRNDAATGEARQAIDRFKARLAGIKI